MFRWCSSLFALVVALPTFSYSIQEQPRPARIALFEVEVTPPIGTSLCDGLVKPAKEVADPLFARGIVLFAGDRPIVLCAVDWVGIGNSGYDQFREALARAAVTTPDHVALHCLHQHDAPGCDFEADEILMKYGLGGKLFDPVFARKAMERIAAGVKKAAEKPVPFTHVGIGKAKVFEVASSRRVMGPDGKVKYVRYSATPDPKIRAEPEGLIDPYVQLIGFWNGDKPDGDSDLLCDPSAKPVWQGRREPPIFPALARRLRERESARLAARPLQRRRRQRHGRQVQRRRPRQSRDPRPNGSPRA